MSDFGTVWRAHQKEVEDRILSIVPSERPTTRFRRWSPGREDSRQFSAIYGHDAIRLFVVAPPTTQDVITIGSGVHKLRCVSPIVIGYPLGDEYAVALRDDYDAIRRCLNANHTETDSVDFRVVSTDGWTPPEEDEEHKWQWVNVPLLTVLETDA